MNWVLDPSSRDFDLSELVLLTAMTGEENEITEQLMDRYLLPVLRREGLRYVQICRAGQAKRHGYVVLDDSRTPEQMHMIGPWRLSDELRTAGTLPSVRNGYHWCSERAKGDPLDWWVADHMPSGYRHITGYAFGEEKRATKDAAARTEKEGKGKALPSRPEYPLLHSWQWTREKCARFLWDAFGVEWSRSCCSFCPFQSTAGGRPELLARWRSNPTLTARTLMIEATALSLNERIGMFGTGDTAFDLVRREGLADVLEEYRRLRAEEPTWDLIEVRRAFDAKANNTALKGTAWRSVQVRATGSLDEMLGQLYAVPGAIVSTDSYGISRAWVRRRPEANRYPLIEWLWTIAPSGTLSKQRTSFEATWGRIRAQVGA
jgi:hypothetical protein